MGLTAHFYKTKILHNATTDNAKEIAYLRNNWSLHNYLGTDVVLITKHKLNLLEDFAMDNKEFNKDFGDGESVLSAIRKARKAIQDGFIVLYEGSY